MIARSIVFAAVLAFVPVAAGAHSPGAVPKDPAKAQQYKAGMAAYGKRDYAAALKAWRPLAEAGVSAAQLFVGFMHARGQGVPKDAAAAAVWYRRAGEKDHKLAQIKLGMMYSKGDGVARDPVAAYLWASLAARDEKHVKNIAEAARRDLRKQMTPKQIAEAERRTREWLETHKKVHK